MMMYRRIALTLLILVLGALSLSAQSRVSDRRKAIRKIEHVLEYIDNNYIDEVPLDTLVEAALVAIFDKLDPHSRYMPTAEMRRMMDMLHSEFAGIGINYTLHHDTLVVRRIIENSPAHQAKLLYGDRIIAINNHSIVGLERDSIRNMLRGQQGTKLQLDVLRCSDSTRHNIEITRDYIASPSVATALKLNDSTAYIRIENFARNTPQEFRRALATMKDYRSLIIDLRGNSGGLLASVVDICGIFLKENTLILTTEGRSEPTQEFRTKNCGELCDVALTVLIDEQTASASEVFAGAMQDNDRATIIGRTSYGKGLIQRLVNLGDNSGMAVTRALYKTPAGRAIQRPYTKGDKQSYHNDRSRYNHPDSLTVEHSPEEMFYTLNEGREVYGGGGITPDIYIAAEHIDTASYRGRAIIKGVIDEVIINLFDRKGYGGYTALYPTADEFAEYFEFDSISREVIDQMMQHSEPEDAEVQRLLDDIRARIVRDIYGEEAFIRMFMCYDEPLMRALELHK